MKKILIIKQTSLGDILHSTVAFDIIKHNFPDCEITFMVDKSGVDIIKNNPNINKIIEFDLNFVESNFLTHPLKVLKYLISKIKEVRKQKFDYAFDLQGLERTAFFLYFARSKEKYIKGRYPFLKGFRNKYLHATQEIANVFKVANFKIPSLNMQLYIKENVKEEKFIINSILNNIKNFENISKHNFLNNNLNNNNFKNNFIDFKSLKKNFKLIVLSPYTRWETKNWGLNNFFELLNIVNTKLENNNLTSNSKNLLPDNSDLISNNKKFIFIFTGTSSNEREISEGINKNKNNYNNILICNLAGKLTLEQFIILLSKTDLIVTGDSFASHAANALHIPLIVLFGPTDEKRVGLLYPENSVVIRDKELKCQKCYKRKCPLKTNKMACMNNIKPGYVYKTMIKLLFIN